MNLQMTKQMHEGFCREILVLLGGISMEREQQIVIWH
jgi:hypothetical protein